MILKKHINEIDLNFSNKKPSGSLKAKKQEHVKFHQDMSLNEISDIVSDIIIEVIKEQFDKVPSIKKKGA